MKSPSLVLFKRLLLAASLVGIANILVHYGRLRDIALASGAATAGPMLGIILLALSFFIFWFFVSVRRSKAAKWLFVVVTTAALAMVPARLDDVLAVGRGYAIIDGAALALQLAAAAVLFRRDVRKAFASP